MCKNTTFRKNKDTAFNTKPKVNTMFLEMFFFSSSSSFFKTGGIETNN